MLPVAPRSLSQLYSQTLPKESRTPFRAAVLEETGHNQSTFYDWVNGTTTPSKAVQKILVDQLNIFLPGDETVTREELFPVTSNSK